MRGLGEWLSKVVDGLLTAVAIIILSYLIPYAIHAGWIAGGTP